MNQQSEGKERGTVEEMKNKKGSYFTTKYKRKFFADLG